MQNSWYRRRDHAFRLVARRGTRTGVCMPQLRLAGFHSGSVRREWKTEGKHGAAIFFIAAGDLALMVLYDAITGAETQAGALPDWLGRVEGIEDAFRGRHSWT